MNNLIPEMVERIGCPIAVLPGQEADIVELHQQGHPGATGSLTYALASPRVILRYSVNLDIATFHDHPEEYNLERRPLVAASDLWLPLGREKREGEIQIAGERIQPS